MKNRTLTVLAVLSVSTAQAQIKNADFENWTNLHPHVYETEMVDSHNVENPQHGDVDDWIYSFDVGVSQTTDAHTGTYAAILHNWYNYAQTTLEFRDTISTYPTEFSGYFKYISDPFSAGTVTIIVVSTAGDTISNEMTYFGLTTDWTSFSVDLNPSATTDPADSIFILFTNATESCQGNFMTCNLLYLDDLSTTSSATAAIDDLDAIGLELFPNPTEGKLTIRYDRSKVENNMTLEIFDMTGQQVLIQAMEQSELSLDLQHLETGSYIVKLSTEDGNATHRQLLVQ